MLSAISQNLRKNLTMGVTLYLHDESKQENGYRLSRMLSQDSCWHLRWLETELTLTGERSAVNVARSVRRGLAGKAGSAARWLVALQFTQKHVYEATNLSNPTSPTISFYSIICYWDGDINRCSASQLTIYPDTTTMEKNHLSTND